MTFVIICNKLFCIGIVRETLCLNLIKKKNKKQKKTKKNKKQKKKKTKTKTKTKNKNKKICKVLHTLWLNLELGYIIKSRSYYHKY